MNKIKIHIVCASFGSEKPLVKTIPPQINDKYDISLSLYDDTNTSSRVNSMHPRLKGKIPKMLEWQKFDADYYIWLDSNFEIVSNNIGGFVERSIAGFDLCLHAHPWNKTILEESMSVLSGINSNDEYLLNRYKGEPIAAQYNSYTEDKTFVDNTLFSLGMFIYTKKLVSNKEYNVLTDWFFHNCIWSIEDQISLPYLLHKHGTKYTTFKIGSIYDNALAKYNV